MKDLPQVLTNCCNPWQVSLLTESGDTKDDLRLPTDDQLLTQVLTCTPEAVLSLFVLSAEIALVVCVRSRTGLVMGRTLW